MKRYDIRYAGGFEVVGGNARSQAAAMVLAPGETVGGHSNLHEESDQWLYVVSGRGEATVDELEHQLRAGTLLLIERGEPHEIRNVGDAPLETLNFYVPPEY